MASQNSHWLDLEFGTSEHIGLMEKRRAKKRLSTQQIRPPTQLLERPWLSLVDGQQSAQPNSELEVAVLTWNLLAQTLVRRELFPTSDCLRASQREHLLHEEILRLDAQVICLQEVDRMEKLGPVLEAAGYSYRYATGPNKNHGCVIGFKNSIFSVQDEKVVFYDQEEVRPEGTESQRHGRSYNTRNIALILALQKTDLPTRGLVVSTTHLFWHPRYAYERARQAGILKREVVKFRDGDHSRERWPCILTGDFNFSPEDPTYALLTTGNTLLPEQEERLLPSYVIHNSVDPTVPDCPLQSAESKDDEEGGDSETMDPDRDIMNARPARPEDGLLSIPELISFHSQTPRVQSAYAVGLSKYKSLTEANTSTFGSNNPLMTPSRPGYYEPEYTSYTHYWKSVLDYIFILSDSDTGRFEILGFLSPLGEKELEPGLPQKAVCGSDHLPLVAQIRFRE